MSTFTMDYEVTHLTIDEIKPLYLPTGDNSKLSLVALDGYWFAGTLVFRLIPETYGVFKSIFINLSTSNPDIYFHDYQYKDKYNTSWSRLNFPFSVTDLETTYIKCSFKFPYAMWADFLEYYNFNPFGKQLTLNNFTGYIKSEFVDDATATLVETQHKLKFVLDSTDSSYSLKLKDNNNFVPSVSPTDSWKVITAKPQFIKCYRRPDSSVRGEFEIKLQLPYKITHSTSTTYFPLQSDYSEFGSFKITNYEDNIDGTLITIHCTYVADTASGVVKIYYSPMLGFNNTSLNVPFLQFNASSDSDYNLKIKKQSLDCLEFIEDSTLAYIKIQKGIRIWAKEFIEENNSTNTKLKNDITVVAKEFKEVF